MHHTLVNDQGQTFLFLLGPGASGKSICVNIQAALVGHDNVVNTSLKSMNLDQFETSNYFNKSLITINDSELFRGSLATLKQLTGGDSIKGRKKLVQGSFDFYYTGLVVIISNFPLEAQDASGSVERRLKLLKADHVVPQRQPSERIYY